jgi:hypothetical protein
MTSRHIRVERRHAASTFSTSQFLGGAAPPPRSQQMRAHPAMTAIIVTDR